MRARRSQCRAAAARVFAAVLGAALAAVGQAGAGGAATAFAEQIRPLLQEHCFECHATDVQKGDLDLEQFATLAAVRRQPATWQSVRDKLGSGEMPPATAPQPDPAARARLLAWTEAMLADLAHAHAGDPGPVVLRRLGNAEYTYAVRDLTGVASLDPAREFPADGAAGEGFTNVGDALVMSPMLVDKYFAAGKAIAEHAVLLPGGLRFMAAATRRDQTDELLAEIRTLYRRYSDPAGADVVDLQGIVFATNGGGRLPLAQYCEALQQLRGRETDQTAIAAVAAARGLSPRYLTLLGRALTAGEPSLLLEELRRRWHAAGPGDLASLVAWIAAWQQSLWRFRPVGHVGKVGGPQQWLEPVQPLVDRQEFRCRIVEPAEDEDVVVRLVAGDVGGNGPGDVVWREPRLVMPGRPDLPLREVQGLARSLMARRARIHATVVPCLAAAVEAAATRSPVVVEALADRHGVPADVLAAWFDCLGLGAAGTPAVQRLATELRDVGGAAAVRGFADGELPCVLANSSDQHLRIPGNMLPHSVAVHPSPALRVVVGWRSPEAARVRVAARIQHAHTDCGNGVAWAVELRRGAMRLQLAAGLAVTGEVVAPTVARGLPVAPGDQIAIVVGSRDGDHGCDLTRIDLAIATLDAEAHEWDLARDVAPDLLAGNPHADVHGTPGVWHFGCEPDTAGAVIPAGSLLARWLDAAAPAEQQRLAASLQRLLVEGPRGANDADARLHALLSSFAGPLYRGCRADDAPAGDDRYGLDPARFGRHPDGTGLAAGDLFVRAPASIAIRLPARLAAGCELLVTGQLDARTGAEGAVQLLVSTATPAPPMELVPGPIVVGAGSATRRRLEAALDEFRALFPAALCYEQIVPVDEVVTLTLFHREDGHLVRLLLDGAEAARLDRLWEELHFVSQDALTLVAVFEQLWQYATQDADPSVFEPLREPIRQRADAFREQLAAAEPHHLDAVLAFAGRAFRRPLTADEAEGLRALYRRLRQETMAHDAAIRLLLARVLLAPAFLYRSEQPGPGRESAPVTAHELATRLSSFLWSSVPDDELRAAADSGRLLDPDELSAQARRLLADPRARRLAVEFGCTWLHLRDFDVHAEKSERHFPTFGGLRAAMYEEAIRCFTDLVQADRSVLSLLDSDHTFLNGPLAEHYGIPGVTGPEWRRVDGVQQHGRGGILGTAAVLAKQAGASRTSPILRGNWVAEVLLGDRLPRPPKDVPKLPEDETTEALTVRQLVERHRSDARCARCHERIDHFGFALEGFDAIGRRRDRDLGGRPIDTRATAMDGASFEGIDGLRQYLLAWRREAFLRQFARKLLGYALGRAVQLGDEPLLQGICADWPAHGHRFSFVLERILQSRQFLRVRGRDHRDE